VVRTGGFGKTALPLDTSQLDFIALNHVFLVVFVFYSGDPGLILNLRRRVRKIPVYP